MPLKLFTRTLFVATAAFTIASSVFGKDIAGSSDHPLLSRFDTAVIAAYQVSDFDEVRLPNGPVVDDKAPESVLALEGRITRIAYRIPGEKTALEVIRNYEQALADSDFSIDFTCTGNECGRRFANFVVLGSMFPQGFERGAFNPRSRALLASRQKDDIPVHVFLYVMEDSANKRTLIRQIVVEGETMQTGAVTVRDAEVLHSELEEQGRTVVDGIFFETDSADVRAESSPALEQMAALLAQNAELNVYVVGHTDNVGSLDYNLRLSQRRAAAVVTALVEQHGIDGKRLDPRGVASLSPRASNAADAGRALNRRVELVIQ